MLIALITTNDLASFWTTVTIYVNMLLYQAFSCSGVTPHKLTINYCNNIHVLLVFLKVDVEALVLLPVLLVVAAATVAVEVLGELVVVVFLL